MAGASGVDLAAVVGDAEGSDGKLDGVASGDAEFVCGDPEGPQVVVIEIDVLALPGGGCRSGYAGLGFARGLHCAATLPGGL